MEAKGNSHPYLRANCVSRLFYCWLNDILKKGSQRKIEPEDMYEVLNEDSSSVLCRRLEIQWKRELSRPGEGSTPSLAKALMRTFGPQLLFWSFVVLFLEAVKITCPFLIGGLIKYFVHESIDLFTASMYALGICLCAIAPTLIHHPLFLVFFTAGMRMRVSCSALVYKKLMKLSLSSLDKTTVGQMMNLMSNDVLRFDFAIGLLPYLFVGPLEVIVVSILLWLYIGWAAFSGMLILMLAIPITVLIAKIISKLRSRITLLTDKRLSLMNELLHGIQLVKMSCWEVLFEQVITKKRIDEVKKLYKAGYARGVILSMSFYSGKLIILATFLTYVLLGNKISAEIVFVTMSLYNPVKFSMTLGFPMAMQFGAETLITIGRIQTFLLLDEKQGHLENQESVGKHHLNAKNLCIAWDPKHPVLSNLSFDLKGNDLLMVVGSVGAGKTSLLLSILKELPLLEGTMTVVGRVAYVPQSPWIFNASIRKNVILGSNFDLELYKKVIEFSALQKDLDQMPDGDETNVGDRGTTLSGGQKARVGLARALYRNADIYLLDDPLSAVDSNVSQYLFSSCINGFLANKLRILVTHQLQYLPRATEVLILDKNQKHVSGSFHELVRMGVDFIQIIKESKKRDDNIDTSHNDSTKLNASKNLSKSTSYIREDEGSLSEILLSKSVQNLTAYKGLDFSTNIFPSLVPSESTLVLGDVANDGNVKEMNDQEEGTMPSTIPLKLYMVYFKSGGGMFICILCFILNVLAQASFIITDWWLVCWCSAVEEFDNTMMKNLSSTNTSLLNYPNYLNINQILLNETFLENYPHKDFVFPHNNFYLLVFSILTFVVVVLGVVRAVQFFHMTISSSHNLHNNMVHTIIRCPISFFTEKPAGQILNRFSKDLGQADEHLSFVMFDLVQCAFLVIGVIIIITVSNPLVILAIIPVFIIFVLIRNYFLKTLRNVKRIEAINKSPVFSFINTTFLGLITIRCHQVESWFIKEFNGLQDIHTSAFSLFLFLNRWFAIRLEWLCTILICVVTYASLLAYQFVSGASVGLSLTYVMTLLWLFQWVIRQSTEVQGLMVSVERMVEYTELPTEKALDSLTQTPLNWPIKGLICFQEVTLQYKSTAPYALHGITFTINPGDKIGIVGRTGAGKSSLINVMFRMFDFEGTILVDDVDISNVSLHHLRRKLSIIPQDPILFSGSLRRNLDPLSEHSDDQLWSALRKVELHLKVNEMENGLNTVITQGGTSMSLGQRQLLCMARALLRNNKILIIDEATANVDRHTDKLIQKMLREEFVDCTVLSIAHRLNTIIDHDKILVLESGRIVEEGVPHGLLQNSEGAFYKLAKQSGHSEFINLSEMARNSFSRMQKHE